MVGRLQLFTAAAVLVSGALWAEASDRSAPVTHVIFVAFDTETTGFSPQCDRIVEIGAVKFRGDGDVLASTNWLVNPGMTVPFYATEVHGITTEMVATAPAFPEVWSAFIAFCGDSVLLAHNASFDISFIQAELARTGINPPPLRVGDTLPLFRAWFPQSRSHALEPLAADLGLDRGETHRARADSLHIVDIFNAGMKQRPQLQMDGLERELGGYRRLDRQD